MRLKNKIALITGAASGFGKGMAIRFAKEGAKLILVDKNKAALNELASEIKSEKLAICADIGKKSEIKRMIKEGMDKFSTLDILVNNAAVTHENMALENVSEDDFEQIYQVNMKAIFHTCQLVVPIMKKQGFGTILSTASTAGLRPRPGLVWYNASKAWLINVTKTMALELAPFNIRVNCLCPVAGDTPMLAQFMGGDNEEIRAKFKSVIPLGRFSTPRDIANGALYLCSDEADFITGVALEIDGGRTI